MLKKLIFNNKTIDSDFLYNTAGNLRLISIPFFNPQKNLQLLS